MHVELQVTPSTSSAAGLDMSIGYPYQCNLYSFHLLPFHLVIMLGSFLWISMIHPDTGP